MKKVVLVENAKVGMNYSYEEREYMKENIWKRIYERE